MARCQRNQSLLGQRCKFFSVSSWKIINYTMKKKKKRNIDSEQLSHGRGTKELRCITMLWVKKKKKGGCRPNFWLRDSCTVCISYRFVPLASAVMRLYAGSEHVSLASVELH